MPSAAPHIRSTTILVVRRQDHVAMGGDGQVTMANQVVIKQNTRKLRVLNQGRVLCGFAGATADAMVLLELLEENLERHAGGLRRAAVEMAKRWRTDRSLNRLDAMILAADKEVTLLLTGAGDVIEAPDGVMAIGSGGNFALAAARALCQHTEFGARQVVEAAMQVAAQMCVFTNDVLQIEELGPRAEEAR